MIDYYYSIPELNTKDRIQECINYYQEKGYDDYYDYYDDYDEINELKLRKDYDDKNKLFLKGKMIKITTNFMRWCHLEAIKRCIETQSDKDTNKNINVQVFKFHAGREALRSPRI